MNVSKGSSFRFRLRQGVRRTFLIYSLPALIPRASPSSSDIKLRRCLPFFHPAACLIYLHAAAEIIEVRRLVKLPPGRSRLVRQLARDSKSLRPLSLSHTICPCFGHLCLTSWLTAHRFCSIRRNLIPPRHLIINRISCDRPAPARALTPSAPSAPFVRPSVSIVTLLFHPLP